MPAQHKKFVSILPTHILGTSFTPADVVTGLGVLKFYFCQSYVFIQLFRFEGSQKDMASLSLYLLQWQVHLLAAGLTAASSLFKFLLEQTLQIAVDMK